MWETEDLPKGATCVYSDDLGFNILVSADGKVEHVEDTQRGSSYSRLTKINQEIERLTKLRDKIRKDLTW